MVSSYQSRDRSKSLFVSLLVITLALGGAIIVPESVLGVATSSEMARVGGETKSYKIARDLSSIVSLDPTHYYRVPQEPILVLLYGSLADFLADYSVGEGGRRHILTLKPDLKFASGNPITAEDLAFTIKRAIRLSQLPRDHYV